MTYCEAAVFLREFLNKTSEKEASDDELREAIKVFAKRKEVEMDLIYDCSKCKHFTVGFPKSVCDLGRKPEMLVLDYDKKKIYDCFEDDWK